MAAIKKSAIKAIPKILKNRIQKLFLILNNKSKILKNKPKIPRKNRGVRGIEIITLIKITHHLLYQGVSLNGVWLYASFINSVVSFSIGKDASPNNGAKKNVVRIINLIW